MPYDDRAIERAAEAAHEVNRIYCRALGDLSHEHWEDTPSEIRDTVRAGVRVALQTISPQVQHHRWREAKQAAGWTWGPRKDPEAKTHPNLVPWSQLPPWEQAKDTIFGVVVRAVLEQRAAANGFEAVAAKLGSDPTVDP
jgi:hypothetical protein